MGKMCVQRNDLAARSLLAVANAVLLQSRLFFFFSLMIAVKSKVTSNGRIAIGDARNNDTKKNAVPNS